MKGQNTAADARFAVDVTHLVVYSEYKRQCLKSTDRIAQMTKGSYAGRTHAHQWLSGVEDVEADEGATARLDAESGRAKLAAAKPSREDVDAFFDLKKSLVREMEWVASPSKKASGWAKFESRCFIGSTVSDEIEFRAQYRARAIEHKQQATIEIPEAFYVSIWIRNYRVYGIDTKPGQVHTNAVVPSMPYSGFLITSLTHEHIWTVAADDYVEPIVPPILELKEAIEKFCDRVNLLLNGPFVHPLKGVTEQLL